MKDDTKRLKELAGLLEQQERVNVGFEIKGTEIPMYIDLDQDNVLIQAKKAPHPYSLDKQKKNGFQQMFIDGKDIDKLIVALKKIKNSL